MALVLLVQVPGAGAASGLEDAAAPPAGASPDAPTITIWYGDAQSFGLLGNPQAQINILGNAAKAIKAEYRLNDETTWHELSLGTGSASPILFAQDELLPDGSYVPGAISTGGNKRLVNDGDFNIEVFASELREGENTVWIKATGNGETSTSVTVNYDGSHEWPLPYVLDWNEFSDLEDALQQGKVQVVDGEWYLFEEGGEKWLRPVEEAIGYDRSVAIGDVQWKDFDVLALIHLKRFVEEDVGNIGIMVRWQGHSEAESGEQPLTGWWASGVYGMYRHHTQVLPEDPPSRLELAYAHLGRLVDDSGFRVKRADPYYWRLRVQTKDPAPFGLYSMKVWKSGDEEPDDWVFVVEDNPPDALESGSLLLAAHEADALFGRVEVKPILDIDVTTVGPGSVEIAPELLTPSDAYLHGDTITLTAIPDDPSTYTLAGWSGDLTGMENPASLTLERSVAITATFSLKRTLTVGVDPAGSGEVMLDPPGGVYGDGTVVTLTPKPGAGWTLERWSGPSRDDLVDLGNGSWSITMDADKDLTADFVPGYSLTITTQGQGTVETDPPGLGFPTGTRVKLTARPDWGWYFAGWSGDLQGRANPDWLTIDAAKVVEATFLEASTAFLPVLTRNAK
jgi:hypothetical protein